MGGETTGSGATGRDERLATLLDTMRAFAEATTDYPVLLETVASSVARLIGDACVIVLISDDGKTARAAAVSTTAEATTTYLRDALADEQMRVGEVGIVADAIRTGEPLLIPAIEPTELAGRVAARFIEIVLHLGIHSALSVPLKVRGKTIGGLALYRFEQDSSAFDADDLAFASGLADHGALAISNARLLESVRSELAERKRAEEETKTFAALVQNSTDLIAMAGLDGKVLFVNAAGRLLLGLPPDTDVRTLHLSDFHTTDGLARADIIRAHGSWRGEGFLRHFVSGALIPTSVSSFLVRDAHGEAVCFATVQTDMREKNRLEVQLRQAQKLEAVGRLAGGIAHDFNNLLTVILSYASILKGTLPSGSPASSSVEEIEIAGERAAALTRQLLAFSRQQVLELRVLDLNAVVLGMQTIVRTLLTEDIELVVTLGDDVGRIAADPSQVEQVIVNLVVNARDAMPRGGVLTLATKGVILDADEAARVGTAPGAYAVLVASDTGVGIDEATKPYLFEPFFTTKETGKGTGLGLATILGIVKQTGGHITLESERGKGATFQAYFPRVELALSPSAAHVPRLALQGGNERILLVEDETQVRVLMRSVLRRAGYDVIDAPSPEEALLEDARIVGPLPLLVTDVVLPRMSGRDLAERFLERRPGSKVLYISGYTEDILGERGVLVPGLELLRKPVTPDALLRRVRTVLDA